MRKLLCVYGLLTACLFVLTPCIGVAQTTTSSSDQQKADAPLKISKNDQKALSRQVSANGKALQRINKELSDISRDQTKQQDDIRDAVKALNKAYETVKAIEEKHGETTKALKRLQDELGRCRADVNAQSAQLKSAVVIGEESDALKKLKRELKNEQRNQKRQEEILAEREKEVKDLRGALDERDKLLKQLNRQISELQSSKTEQKKQAAPSVKHKAQSAKKEEKKKRAEAVKQKNMQKAKELTERGNLLLQEGKVKDAEKCFEKALKIDVTNPDAKVGLASCMYTRGDWLEARERVKDVLKKYPDNAQALGLLGIISWRAGDLKSAEGALREALNQDKDDAQLYNYMGIVKHSLKQEPEAVKALSSAVELNPKLSEAQFNLAVVLVMSEPPNIGEARKHYEEAVKLGVPKDEKLEAIIYEKQ